MSRDKKPPPPARSKGLPPPKAGHAAGPNGRSPGPATGKLDLDREMSELLPRPEFYYDVRSKGYYTRTPDGRFIPINEKGLNRRMGELTKLERAAMGYGRAQDYADFVQDNFYVDYADRLAGYPVGLWTVAGRRLLITRESRPAEPGPGDGRLVAFWTELVGADKVRIVFSWLKLALIARETSEKRLREGKLPNFRPGQYLAIVGPPNDGKTIGSRIVVWTISGLDDTKGDLSQYHKGETSFNSDGAKHETHVIDDEGGSDNHNDRRAMAEFIKKSVSQQEKRIHAKGREAEVFEVFNRTLILLNSEQADLRILPELEEGVRDKIILVKSVSSGKLPGPKGASADTTEGADYHAWFDWVREGVPDFVRFLREFEIPDDLKGGRFGMIAPIDEELEADLEELSPVTQLMELIDGKVFADEGLTSDVIVRTTGELFEDLGKYDRDRLLAIGRTPAAFGKIVHMAAKRCERQPVGVPRRVVKLKRRAGGGAVQFEISRPTS